MAGHVAGIVHDHIPLTRFKGVETTIAVTHQLLCLGKQVGIGLAAVKQGHLVARVEYGLYHVGSDKAGATQYQYL